MEEKNTTSENNPAALVLSVIGKKEQEEKVGKANEKIDDKRGQKCTSNIFRTRGIDIREKGMWAC